MAHFLSSIPVPAARSTYSCILRHPVSRCVCTHSTFIRQLAAAFLSAQVLVIFIHIYSISISAPTQHNCISLALHRYLSILIFRVLLLRLGRFVLSCSPQRRTISSISCFADLIVGFLTTCFFQGMGCSGFRSQNRIVCLFVPKKPYRGSSFKSFEV